MADPVLFDFAVPDELLQEVVAKSNDPEAVAALDVMPGTGEGKATAPHRHPPGQRLRPPDPADGGGPRAGQLRQRHLPHRHQPRALLPHPRRRPRGRDLRGRGGPTAVGGAPGPVGRPGQPQGGGRGGPADLLGLRPADGPRHQRLGLHLPLPDRLGRVRRQQHRPQLVPVRRLSHRGPRPGLQLAQPLGPAVPDRRHLAFGFLVTVGHRLALGAAHRPGRHPHRPGPVHPATSRTRGPTSRATSSRPRAWTSTPSRAMRRGSCWGRR